MSGEPEEQFEPVIIKDVLDLHGFFPEQIPEVVGEFLASAVSLNLKDLRIIHGKGRSRLKYEVHEVLKGHPAVAWFGDAPPGFGSWGATVIELKTRTPDIKESDSE